MSRLRSGIAGGGVPLTLMTQQTKAPRAEARGSIQGPSYPQGVVTLVSLVPS